VRRDFQPSVGYNRETSTKTKRVLEMKSVRIFTITMALAGCLGAATAPIITYTASGTFATVATSGADALKLAGEPFNVSIAVSSSTPPYKYGANWAAYHQLKLTGTVHSGLLGSSPISIASNEASIIQAVNPGKDDQFTMEAPVKVVGVNLTITALIVMPLGTIKNQLLHPFSSTITLTPAIASMSYSDGTNTTVLAIQTGTLSATIPGGAATAPGQYVDPAPVDLKRIR
jgi:hypothetical protein